MQATRSAGSALTSLSETIRKAIAASPLQSKLSPQAGAIVAVIKTGTIDLFPLGTGVMADTPMEIGSVTKVFTALLVADAVRRHELQFSTPIDNLLFREEWPAPPAIDVEQLATHTSGLPRLSMSKWEILLSPRDPYREYTREHLIHYLRQKKPRVPVVTQFAYSNFGYAVLGLMLEKAASKTYEQLLQDRLLASLNMPQTGLQLPRKPDRAGGGYNRSGHPASLWHQDAYAPCGALVSTITDLVSAVQAFLDPAHPLAETLALTLQPRVPIPGGNVGLGWILPSSGNAFWHNGATAGYTSYLGVYVPARTGIVIVVNQALPKEATELGHQLLRVVAQNLQGAPL